MNSGSFAELPWDLIARLSVTLASLSIVLYIVSRVIYGIARHALHILILALAIAGAAQTGQFLREHQLLEYKNWAPQLAKLHIYFVENHPVPQSYVDQAIQLAKSNWVKLTSA